MQGKQEENLFYRVLIHTFYYSGQQGETAAADTLSSLKSLLAGMRKPTMYGIHGSELFESLRLFRDVMLLMH